ncbi:MAG: helix-turn-helix domain-containing protein [Planctomycetaceae bacterium]|nr:helix-turn-helix domain-containing protein [Deltaproteobacteria bacterium]MCB9875939.1 helix-turn-helix domain-containing protein [Planctomycetaceae bacterium]
MKSEDSKQIVLSETQAAQRLALTPRALQAWRYQGRGPKFVRISARCVRYRVEDLDAWLEARIVQSTSEPTSADLVEGARQ